MARKKNAKTPDGDGWEDFRRRKAEHIEYANNRPEPSKEEREQEKARQLAELEERLAKDEPSAS